MASTLQILVEGMLGVTLILDLLHVLEKLWKAAYGFHTEGSLEAELWVLDRTMRILFGEVSQVVKGIRQSVIKRRLSGAKRKTLCGVATTYIAIALVCAMTNTSPTADPPPVALSRAHARASSSIGWSVPEWAVLRAEAIVQLRAIYLSRDFDRYWSFHITKDLERFIPGIGASS